MPNTLLTTTPSFLRTLCNLRWVAIVGQAVTVLVALGPLGIALPRWPLWGGIGALALFNVYATWRSRRPGEERPGEAFAHMLVDVAVLSWLVAWSGGIGNPFSSMFLLLIAVSALALPLRVTGALGEPSSDYPSLWLLGVLAVSIGAPFAILSATAPLVLTLLGTGG